MLIRSQKGGILGFLLGGIALTIVVVVVIGIVIANSVKVQTHETDKGGSVRIQTPLGDMNIDARDSLKPETIGVPIYPGATRENGNHGGVTFDFSSENGVSKNISVVAASYSTDDSPDQVREFYRSHLPNWTVTQHHGNKIEFHFSEGGYKRIIGIDDRHGKTHIGIASFGEPGVN
jgi:hypothetical protein